MKNRIHYPNIIFFKYSLLILLFPIIKLFLYSSLIGIVLNAFYGLDQFLSLLIVLVLFFDLKSKKMSNISFLIIFSVNLILTYLILLFFHEYLSSKFGMSYKTIKNAYSAFIIVLTLYCTLFFSMIFILRKVKKHTHLKSLKLNTIKTLIFLLIGISVLIFIFNLYSFIHINETEKEISNYINEQAHNIDISFLYNKINSLGRTKSYDFVTALLQPSHPFQRTNIDKNYIIQDTKLLFIFSLFREDFSEYEYHIRYYFERLKRKDQLLYYSTFLHNTAGEYFDLTRIDSIYSDYLEIPDIKSYVKENMTKEKASKIMMNFAGKLSRLEPYLLLGYVYLIELNYQKGDIEEARNYYYKIENLKLPPYFSDERAKEMKSKIDKTINIYSPLLNEK